MEWYVLEDLGATNANIMLFVNLADQNSLPAVRLPSIQTTSQNAVLAVMGLRVLALQLLL
jgi:hypothetical protein